MTAIDEGLKGAVEHAFRDRLENDCIHRFEEKLTDVQILYHGTISTKTTANMPVRLLILEHLRDPVACIEIAAFLVRPDGSLLEAPHLYVCETHLKERMDREDLSSRVDSSMKKLERSTSASKNRAAVLPHLSEKEFTDKHTRDMITQYLLSRFDIVSCRPNLDVFEVTLKPLVRSEKVSSPTGHEVSDVLIDKPRKLLTIISWRGRREGRKQSLLNKITEDGSPPDDSHAAGSSSDDEDAFAQNKGATAGVITSPRFNPTSVVSPGTASPGELEEHRRRSPRRSSSFSLREVRQAVDSSVKKLVGMMFPSDSGHDAIDGDQFYRPKPANDHPTVPSLDLGFKGLSRILTKRPAHFHVIVVGDSGSVVPNTPLPLENCDDVDCVTIKGYIVDRPVVAANFAARSTAFDMSLVPVVRGSNGSCIRVRRAMSLSDVKTNHAAAAASRKGSTGTNSHTAATNTKAHLYSLQSSSCDTAEAGGCSTPPVCIAGAGILKKSRVRIAPNYTAGAPAATSASAGSSEPNDLTNYAHHYYGSVVKDTCSGMSSTGSKTVSSSSSSPPAVLVTAGGKVAIGNTDVHFSDMPGTMTRSSFTWRVGTGSFSGPSSNPPSPPITEGEGRTHGSSGSGGGSLHGRGRRSSSVAPQEQVNSLMQLSGERGASCGCGIDVCAIDDSLKVNREKKAYNDKEGKDTSNANNKSKIRLSAMA